jgi:hypothetical protein
LAIFVSHAGVTPGCERRVLPSGFSTLMRSGPTLMWPLA